MKTLDSFLNSITMYRLVMWGLWILAIIAAVFAVFGWVAYSLLAMLVSLTILFISALASNYLFAKIFKAQRNYESAYITSLILFFVLAPSLVPGDLLVVALTAVVAMVSKYLFAIRKKHIFNPAAIGLFLTGLLGTGLAVWWVATPWLILPTAILGLLILRKVKRGSLFLSFAIVSGVIIFVTQHISLATILLSYPIIFFGTVMLTEPLTTPPTNRLRIAYGAIVGVLSSITFHFGIIFATPELALILGNIFSYAVSPKGKYTLRLVSTHKHSDQLYDFAFASSPQVHFVPGQYLDWTLEHASPDVRGERRSFTIASSPTERHIHLGVRIDPVHGSSFKKKLISMKPGSTIIAEQLSGEFNLPKDVSKKLAFIAGGIGITPFRSMLKFLADTNEKRDIILLYTTSNPDEFLYKNEIEAIKEKIGLKTIYSVHRVSPEFIKENVHDWDTRTFYLSGPEGLVFGYRDLLVEAGISKDNIKIDDFPGY